MEGLYRMDSQGNPEPALAQNCSVSEDGLAYTFTIRTDSVWYQPKQNGSQSQQDALPVTAADFVFAFQRLFDPATGSAAAQDFSCLENAQEVLSASCRLPALGSLPRMRLPLYCGFLIPTRICFLCLLLRRLIPVINSCLIPPEGVTGWKRIRFGIMVRSIFWNGIMIKMW